MAAAPSAASPSVAASAHRNFQATSAGSAPELRLSTPPRKPRPSSQPPPQEPDEESIVNAELPATRPKSKARKPQVNAQVTSSSSTARSSTPPDSFQRHGVRPVATPQRHEEAAGQASQPSNNESVEDLKRKRQDSQTDRG